VRQNRLKQISDSIAEEVFDLWWEHRMQGERFLQMDRVLPAIAQASEGVLATADRRLSDPDRRVRGAAISAVGTIGTIAATEPVLRALAANIGHHEALFEGPSWAIGRMGSAAATHGFLSHLACLLEDGDYRARAAAAWTIAQLGPAAATQRILDTLLNLLPRLGDGARLRRDLVVCSFPPRPRTPEDEECDAHRSAFDAIERMGAAAATKGIIDRLAGLLRDEDFAVSATKSIGAIGPKAATEPIVSGLYQMLQDHGLTRDIAVAAVERLGPAARDVILERLLDQLEEGDGNDTPRAATIICQMRSTVVAKAVLDRLAELLRHKNRIVRAYAATAVRGVGRAAATEPILAGLRDLLTEADLSARSYAGNALIALGSDALSEALLARLEKSLRHDDMGVRCTALRVLAELGAPDVTGSIKAALLQLVQDREESFRVRAPAVEALCAVGREAVTSEMLAVLARLMRSNEHHWIVSAAIAGAGTIGSAAATKDILDRLVELLRDEDPMHRGFRQTAVRVLGQMGGKAATESVLAGLAELLLNRDYTVNALRALANMGSGALTNTILQNLAVSLKHLRWGNMLTEDKEVWQTNAVANTILSTDAIITELAELLEKRICSVKRGWHNETRFAVLDILSVPQGDHPKLTNCLLYTSPSPRD